MTSNRIVEIAEFKLVLEWDKMFAERSMRNNSTLKELAPLTKMLKGEILGIFLQTDSVLVLLITVVMKF